MKKIGIIIMVFITIFCFNPIILKAEKKNHTNTYVTEKIPGLGCSVYKTGSTDSNGNQTPTLYECKVGKGTGPIMSMLGEVIKYFTMIALLLGILFIVYNGILYSMGGLEASLKEESKKRIIATLIGLLLLLSSGYILQIIAPWVYK